MVVQRNVGHGFERRLQPGEGLSGGAGTGEFLVVQGQAAVFLVDRDQRAVEVAVADGVVGALLAFEGQGVDGFAADAFQRRDGVSADALVRLRVHPAQPHVAAVHGAGAGAGIARAGRHAHQFAAARR